MISQNYTSVSAAFFVVFTQTLNARCCFYRQIISDENFTFYYTPAYHFSTNTFQLRNLLHYTQNIGEDLLHFFQFQKKRRARAMMLGLPYTNLYKLIP